MRVIRFKKGRHYCNFWDLLWICKKALTRKRIRVVFTEESYYDLKDNDQNDWNKIIGRGNAQRFFNRKKRTETFLVWRLKDKKQYQIAKYYRQGEKFWWDNIIDCSPYTVYDVDISFFNGVIPIGGYFGGNEKAPNDLSFRLW